MFDLERAIQKWKKELYQTRLEEGDLHELEVHLRDSISAQQDKGIRAEQAFEQAVSDLGHPKMIESELKRSTKSESFRVLLLKHLMLIGFRSLLKRRFYTMINVLGLAVGFAGFFLIGVYVNDELSFDQFHPNPDQIYHLGHQLTWEDGTLEDQAWSASGWVTYLADKFPEITEFSRFVRFSDSFLTYEKGDKVFHEDQILWVDPNFFLFFGFDLMTGDPETVLEIPHSIVLTEKTALKYFGDQDPIGEIITFNNWGSSIDLSVTGIMKDPPVNTQIRPDFLANIYGLQIMWNWNGLDTNMGGTGQYSYIRVTDPSKIDEYCKSLKTALETGLGNWGERISPFFIPLPESHFTPQMKWQLEATSDYDHLYTLMVIALLIILLAAVNYINLSTALAGKRAKEVGLRKTLGGSRAQLQYQFFIESLLTVFTSVILSLAFIWIFWPYFNDMIGRDLDLFAILFGKGSLIALLAFSMIIGMLSSLYPAFYLSSFRPVEVFKRQVAPAAKLKLGRIGLVIFQFTAAIALMISSYIFYRQLQFINSSNLSRDQEITVSIRTAGYGIDNGVGLFRDKMLNRSEVSGASIGMHLPRMEHFALIETKLKVSGSVSREIKWNKFEVDGYFPEVFNLEFLAGRDFFGANDTESVIINEAALRSLDLAADEAIGLRLEEDSINFLYSNLKGQIVGVVRDFPYKTVHQTIEPLAIFGQLGNDRILSIKFSEGNIAEKIALVNEEWKATFPNAPFKYWFLDDEFGKVYFLERRMTRIVPVFTGIAISIAIMGLFGLTSFMTELRRKEMGIRKILGCNISEILILLSWNFIRLILISFLLATPITIFLLNKWLDNFAYRINLEWWIFPVIGLIAIALAFATISFHSLKVAFSNPVESIRYE